jgi:hypothetical protein
VGPCFAVVAVLLLLLLLLLLIPQDTSISAIAVLPRHTSAIEAEIAKFDVHELLNPARCVHV